MRRLRLKKRKMPNHTHWDGKKIPDYTWGRGRCLIIHAEFFLLRGHNLLQILHIRYRFFRSYTVLVFFIFLDSHNSSTQLETTITIFLLSQTQFFYYNLVIFIFLWQAQFFYTFLHIFQFLGSSHKYSFTSSKFSKSYIDRRTIAIKFKYFPNILNFIGTTIYSTAITILPHNIKHSHWGTIILLHIFQFLWQTHHINPSIFSSISTLS